MSQIRRASGTALVAAALLALCGCANTQDAAAGPSTGTQASGASSSAPAPSASRVGDFTQPTQAAPITCNQGHLSLQVYNQTANEMTLSTTSPPTEDDGGIYIDDAQAECTWDDSISGWSNDGAWMIVNTTNATGQGEMASEIYWNLDDQGDVMHAHGWGDYNSTQNMEGTNSTTSSCEVTGPNAADFNCHAHNEWMANWSHGFAHFTLTCANTAAGSACQSWKDLDTSTTPQLGFANTTATAYYLNYPNGASNAEQYFMDGVATVDVNYVFPSGASSKTAYQVSLSNAELAPQSGLPAFALGNDGCSDATYIVAYNGSDASATLCTFEVMFTTATQGADSGSITVELGAAAGPSVSATTSEEVTVDGVQQTLDVGLPIAPAGLTSSSDGQNISTTWDGQSPQNSPIALWTVTATPTSGSAATITKSYTPAQINNDYRPAVDIAGGELVLGQEYAVTVYGTNFAGSGPVATTTVTVG